MRVSWKALVLKFQHLITNLVKQIRRKTGKGRTYLKYTFAKKRNQRRAIYTVCGVVIISLSLGLILHVRHSEAVSSQLQAKLYQRQVKLQNLSKSLKAVQKQEANTELQVQQKATHEADLQKQIDDLNKQLQSKREAQSLATRAVNTVTGTRTAYATPAAPVYSGGCGDNQYSHFIYMKESGCNLSAVNAGGCRGLGQACPGTKLPCGADYACQNAYFSAYASKYGGWAGAYSFWIAHSWW